MSSPQAIIFKKTHFTKRSSANWLKYHGFKLIEKVHETVNYYRYRLKQPDEEFFDYRIIPLDNGIKMVCEFAKYTSEKI